jgi:hypothetical protein
MLAACFALYIQRDADTLWTLGKLESHDKISRRNV